MIASAPAPVITCGRRHPVPLGESVPQMERAAVGIAVERAGVALHGLERSRKRAPGPLVRGELDDALEPELALYLLLRLARLVRNEPVESRTKEPHGPLLLDDGGIGVVSGIGDCGTGVVSGLSIVSWLSVVSGQGRTRRTVGRRSRATARRRSGDARTR